MNSQPGIQEPQKSSSGKKWLLGCGIAVLVVILIVGGLGIWGFMKGKAFLEEWGGNPGLAAIAFVVKNDDTYDIVDKDIEAGTITVKENITGEVSVWTLQKFEEGSETIQITDDKGRIITIGGSSGETFTITEPEPEEESAEEGEEGEEEVVEDAVDDSAGEEAVVE